MGLVTLGPPEDIVLELANLVNANAFVETGTFTGNTTRWASTQFAFVYTIEKAEILYKTHNEGLRQLNGVKPLLGDTRELLPAILEEIKDESAVFWLDAHWSVGQTAGEGDECPLLDELACLTGRSGDIILIDDARLFLCSPPLPHDPSEWPNITDIVETVSSSDHKRFMQIVDDVIFIIPDESKLKNALVKYAQNRSAAYWQGFSELQRGNFQNGGL